MSAPLTPDELARGMDALADRMGLRPSRCADCGVRDPNNAPDCPQLPLPEVLAIGRNQWLVASRTVAPGAYWPVALTHVGGQSVMTCACPAGRRQAELAVADQLGERGCRHLRAVVDHVNARNRRPSYPVDAAKWVD